MLKIAYIATDPVVKTKKPTKRQLFIQAAKETLAVRRAYDRIKAKELFKEEQAILDQRKIYLEKLLKSKNQN